MVSATSLALPSSIHEEKPPKVIVSKSPAIPSTRAPPTFVIIPPESMSSSIPFIASNTRFIISLNKPPIPSFNISSNESIADTIIPIGSPVEPNVFANVWPTVPNVPERFFVTSPNFPKPAPIPAREPERKPCNPSDNPCSEVVALLLDFRSSSAASLLAEEKVCTFSAASLKAVCAAATSSSACVISVALPLSCACRNRSCAATRASAASLSRSLAVFNSRSDC